MKLIILFCSFVATALALEADMLDLEDRVSAPEAKVGNRGEGNSSLPELATGPPDSCWTQQSKLLLQKDLEELITGAEAARSLAQSSCHNRVHRERYRFDDYTDGDGTVATKTFACAERGRKSNESQDELLALEW